MELKEILVARANFARQYCENKGWDLNDLELWQILEIRDQEYWKDPTLKAVK